MINQINQKTPRTEFSKMAGNKINTQHQLHFCTETGLPGGTACNMGDLGSTPGLGRSLEEGMATHCSIFAWRIPWTESLVGYRPWSLKEPDTTEQLSTAHTETSMWPFKLPPRKVIRSVSQSRLTLCNPMDCSTPGFPVHHQLPELAQTHVHWVSDAIQSSHSLSSPSSLAFNLSQHQGLFHWVSSSHQVAKVLEFQL